MMSEKPSSPEIEIGESIIITYFRIDRETFSFSGETLMHEKRSYDNIAHGLLDHSGNDLQSLRLGMKIGVFEKNGVITRVVIYK